MTLKIHLPGIIFTQPERCLPPEKSAMFHKPFIFSASHNHRSPAWHLCVKFSCFGPFTTCPLRIQDEFYCFILVFIINVWQSLEMFPHLNSFHWKTAKWKTGNREFRYHPQCQDTGVNNLLPCGRLTFSLQLSSSCCFKMIYLCETLFLASNPNSHALITVGST